MKAARVIDPTEQPDTSRAWFGATVTIVDEETDEEKTYQIVGEPEADIENNLLNIRSPLARALIGREEGDLVSMMAPGGERNYEIVRIEYL